MKTHFTILADDLSGAADCAVPFARAGFRTEVFLHPEIFARTDPLVGSIDLHTRELASDEASRITSQALRLIQSDRETVWYRKVDSTLRGNIGSDVLSTVSGIPGKRVIFCAPAFPDTGRTTAHGKVFVNGAPLEESGVHSGWPVGKSISDLFTEVGLKTQVLSLDVIRAGPSTILRSLHESPGVRVAICDAQTDLDLLAIAKAGLQIRNESIFVGSAGLAHQIATLWGGGGEDANQLVLADRPILVVVGSRSPTARTQLDLLSDRSGIDILRVPVTASGPEPYTLIIAGLERALSQGRDLAITTDLLWSLDHRHGADLMESLGQMLRPFLDKFAAVVLTGGETARALLFQSEICRLRLIDEIAPGVTLSISAGDPSLPIVIKAGAFGTSTTLLNVVHFLRTFKK
jgi:D-threonate/D-erythronate kinase